MTFAWDYLLSLVCIEDAITPPFRKRKKHRHWLLPKIISYHWCVLRFEFKMQLLLHFGKGKHGHWLLHEIISYHGCILSFESRMQLLLHFGKRKYGHWTSIICPRLSPIIGVCVCLCVHKWGELEIYMLTVIPLRLIMVLLAFLLWWRITWASWGTKCPA